MDIYNSKKKICYITTTSGTLQTFVLPVAKFILDSTNWDITFICNENCEFAESLPDRIHYIPIKMKRGIDAYGIVSMLKIRKILKSEQFDLVQYSTPNASLYASIASWLACIPVRLYCQWGLAYVGMTGLKRKIFRLEERLVCRLSTLIEPDSPSNLEFAIAEKLYPGGKGLVIGSGSACGVNLRKFNIHEKEKWRPKMRMKYGITDDSFVFGFIGRINKDKGINELLSAFKEIALNTENVFLVLVGEDENDQGIERSLYDWSKSANNIIYVGVTKNVEYYLAMMDAYVLPSYREGFGMGTIEAEAMGVPVIVSDIPGPRDAMISGITGLMVEKKNSRSLCSAMQFMMTNDCSYMGVNGHQYVEEKFDQIKLRKLILEDRGRLLE